MVLKQNLKDFMASFFFKPTDRHHAYRIDRPGIFNAARVQFFYLFVEQKPWKVPVGKVFMTRIKGYGEDSDRHRIYAIVLPHICELYDAYMG
jgi:hypothetical protein